MGARAYVGSRRGAALKGGRFNRAGQPALYLSTDFICAVLEYCQGTLARLQPVLACRYEIDVDGIIDLSTESARESHGIPFADLANPWASIVARGKEPASWTLADQLQSKGAAGILVPSFVPRAPEGASNLVLWRWGPDLPTKVSVMDDDGRLPLPPHMFG